jgi:serine/threonine protein kinase
MSQGTSAPASAPALDSLGKYQLVAEIGHGGMADVFLAMVREGGHDQRVVIKRLRADVVEDEDFRAMFLDEARLAMRLQHPHVVRTLEVGKESDLCFIVMEFLDGQPLSRVRRRGLRCGPPPLAVELCILADVLSGLDYVHGLCDDEGRSLGVVHRDVTPQNIFVCYDGQVKVVDFGIAKTETRLAETRIGVVKGKLSYMAPEHARGEVVDCRSDIFSVGIMLWEALMGQRFWHGHEELTIYRRLVMGDLPIGDRGRPIGDPTLARICEKALAVDPVHRYASGRQMQGALEEALRGMGVSRARGAVGAYVRELFAGDRAKFHAAIETELVSLRSGQRRSPPPRIDPAPSSHANSTGSRVRVSPDATSRSVGVPLPKVEETVDFRRGRGARRVALWGVIGVAMGLVGWPVFRAISTEGPAAAASAPLAAALTAVAADPAPVAPPPPLSSVAASVKEEAPVHEPARARPPSRPRSEVSPPADELRRSPRAKRALDAEDPWSR